MKKLDIERNKINDIDKKMAHLFEDRMNASRNISDIKRELGLDVLDKTRELDVINNNINEIKDESLKPIYKDFLVNTMKLSKKYQSDLMNDLTIYTNNKTYEVKVEDNALDTIEKYINLNNKVLIITDENVGELYLDKITNKCLNPYTFIIKPGEASKSIDNYIEIMNILVSNEFTKSDKIISLGGGVVGDLSGFVASTYLRGIPFFNIPTTLLSQIDSSVGGKTAIDFYHIKNVVGSFYQPNKVIIDPTVLQTLPSREFYSGLVEAIKMAIISDEELFNLIYNSTNIYEDIKEVINKSLLIKKRIVEEDTFDEGIRRILNFGHTIGHAIEASLDGKLLHGECVGIGMTYFSSSEVKEKIINILNKYHLPVKVDFDKEKVIDLIKHDKKRNDDMINIVYVEKIGQAEIIEKNINEIKEMI